MKKLLIVSMLFILFVPFLGCFPNQNNVPPINYNNNNQNISPQNNKFNINELLGGLKGWLSGTLFFGVFGGVLASFCGYRIGIKIVGASLASVCVVTAFMKHIAWFNLFGGIAGLTLVGYMFWGMRKSLAENIKGIQEVKKKHPELKESINKTLSGFQKGSTEDLIKVFKKKIEKKEKKNGQSSD